MVKFMNFLKYKIMCLFIFLISIFIFGNLRVDALLSNLPLFGRVIYVDPGHGGRDPGAMYGKLMEKDIVLEISNVLVDKLTKQGAIVYMTRDSDEDLSSKWDPQKKRGDLYRRIMLYKKNKADMYLSIHLNSSYSSNDKGIEVLYNKINKNNKVLGEILIKNFDEKFYNVRELITTDLYMYRNTTTVGVLIECGFLSNSDDRYNLQRKSYQEKLAVTITKSVIEYFN